MFICVTDWSTVKLLEIALYEPEIPPNTGNIIRLCANTGAKLHIIRPMGFDWCDKRLRRAGLDYSEFAQVRLHDNYNAFEQTQNNRQLIGLTTKGHRNYFDFDFQQATEKKPITLIFGPETRGLPSLVLETIGWDYCLKLPMTPSSRSLNLANAAAICLYEAWRQLRFIQAPNTRK